MGPIDQGLFSTGVWKRAVERYTAATHLTVEVVGLDGTRLVEPHVTTPLFDLLDGRQHASGLFAACAHRCLEPSALARPVIEQRYGLAVVGTPLIVADEPIGVAMGGYRVTRFIDQLDTQRLARDSNVPFGELRAQLRRQPPLADERIMVYGELLQTLCDALLSEHQRARQLSETSDKLAAEAEAKDRFLAVLSHELRTPLSAMLGWARMLREGALSADTTRRALEVIERNTKLQAQLIEDLLHVSRIISGKVQLDLRPVALGPLIHAAVETLRPAAEAKTLSLAVVLDPDVSLVLADPERFDQVVSNLLSNAIKFTPTGGRIDVRLEETVRGVVLRIVDSGIGIAPDFLPFVFDRFRQADSGMARAYTGLGLGLTIVRHLVRLHGGSVEAASPGEGKGATFSICLPALPGGRVRFAAPYAAAEAPLRFDDVPKLTGVRVLIVDDERDTREVLTSVLEHHMIEVAAVSSSEEALEVLHRWKPDVLVSDIGMPRESGYDLIRKLRRRTRNEGGHIPAVALTAYAQVEDARRALEAGFQLHVAKPVEPVALALAVARLAGRLQTA
jgi:signal transduction histidine kinase/ActR/RegA family two-component response regulator